MVDLAGACRPTEVHLNTDPDKPPLTRRVRDWRQIDAGAILATAGDLGWRGAALAT